MTDDPDLHDELDPAQERVRRLLADARHDEAVPAEVAARLDAAVARLVDERRDSATAEAQHVVDLDARRRRKRWSTALAAAAAVVVVGVAAPNLAGSLNAGSADEDASSAGSAAEDSSADREFSGPTEEDGGGGDSDGSAEEPSAPSAANELLSLPDVRLDSFRDDAVAAREQAAKDDPEATARLVPCGQAPDEAEQVVRVSYDGQDGYLAFEPAATAGQQVVTLYLCPGGVPVRSAEVPGP